MICIQTSERLFWRAHNSNRLFSYFRFSPRNICSVFEKYKIVWDATWSSRPMTHISETFKLYWPVTEEYIVWCIRLPVVGIASLRLQIYPAQEYLTVLNYVVKPGSHSRRPNVKLPTTTGVSRNELQVFYCNTYVSHKRVSHAVKYDQTSSNLGYGQRTAPFTYLYFSSYTAVVWSLTL
jgi:hypothetical protein